MSLISTFYAGDLSHIRAFLKDAKWSHLEENGVVEMDFSGGISRPWLFPDDFLMLTGNKPSSFWRLKSKSLVKGSECGLYQVPEAEIDAIIAIPENNLANFTSEWSRKRREEADKAQRRASIWRSPAFWKIYGGGAGGLLLALWQHPGAGSFGILLAWLIGGVCLGVFVDRQRKHRRKTTSQIDWMPQLRALQEFLRAARKQNATVYYYWSL